MTGAIVLLSGGLDSSVALAMAKSQGFDVSALSFRYGQRHSAEAKAACRIAESNGIKDHAIVDLNLRLFGKSALTDDITVPKNRSIDEMSNGIPVTYVPARNTIFLSFALAFAETRNAFDIFIGVNALDFSGYPDCRPEFIKAFETMANLATAQTTESNQSLKIHTPMIQKTKAEIIQSGIDLGVDFGLTVSCYEASDDGVACGSCDACLLRLNGFRQCGISDPIKYRTPEATAS